MKAYTYTATVKFVRDGEIASYPLNGEAAEAVIKQAKARQDLRAKIQHGSGEVDDIIPWSAVREVSYAIIPTDAEAPEDDACKEYVASGITLSSDITSAVAADYDAAAKSVTLYYADSTSHTYDFSSSDNIKPYISSVIYKGEEAKETATFSFFKTNEVDTNTVCLTFLAEIDGQTLDKEICFPKHVSRSTRDMTKYFSSFPEMLAHLRGKVEVITPTEYKGKAEEPSSSVKPKKSRKRKKVEE